jgi:uncharacterized protein YciI
MWYLTIQRWTGDRQKAISELVDDHLAWMDSQLQAGNVLLAGPSADMELGIVVFRAANKAAADKLCRADPFVAAGYREFDLIAWDVHQLFGVNASRLSAAP